MTSLMLLRCCLLLLATPVLPSRRPRFVPPHGAGRWRDGGSGRTAAIHPGPLVLKVKSRGMVWHTSPRGVAGWAPVVPCLAPSPLTGLRRSGRHRMLYRPVPASYGTYMGAMALWGGADVWSPHPYLCRPLCLPTLSPFLSCVAASALATATFSWLRSR